jgi:hypothetical protein
MYSQEFVGVYTYKSEPVNTGFIEYNLVLNNDSTYVIAIQRKLNKDYGEVEYFEGKGIWKQEKHKVIFYPELSGEQNEIDMTSVTVRFDIKQKDELLFYSKKKMGWGLNVGMKKQN